MVFDKVLSDLQSIGLEIQKKDREEGIIIAKCISHIVKEFMWRLYGEKIQIEVTKLDGGRTEMNIYAIPNWFRIKVNKNEKLYELSEIVSKIKDVS